MLIPNMVVIVVNNPSLLRSPHYKVYKLCNQYRKVINFSEKTIMIFNA